METKHTPGPWVSDDNEGFSSWSIWSGMSPTGHGVPGPKIAEVVGDSAETDANARLIASAPELLSALCGLFNEVGDFEYDVYSIMAARDAIAKATGASHE